MGAPGADVLVVGRGTAAPACWRRADADVATLATVDPTRAYGRVAGEGEPLPGDVAGALDRGAAAIAAELVGVCQRALDMTVAYVSERRQFGVPSARSRRSRTAARRCCCRRRAPARRPTSRPGRPTRRPTGSPRRRASPARRPAAAATEVTGSAIQAHGGIGFTWEADVHWLFKRAQLDAALLGGGSAARIALARLVAGRPELCPRLRPDVMTVVTISAAYGAGGSEIGPLVAEELGVPFVDRAIPGRGRRAPRRLRARGVRAR